MKKKHKRSSIEALLAVQTVPVHKVAPTEPFRNETGLQKFQREEKERERREERARKAEAERPIRKAQEEHSRLLRELIDADILAGLDTESQFLAATAPNIGNGSQFNGISPEAIRATIRCAFSEFEDSIASEGKFTEKGRLRCQQVARANCEVDWTRVAAWSQLFYLLRTAGEMRQDHFIETPTPLAQPVERTPTLADLEQSDTSTREGRKQAAALLMHSMQGETLEWYRAFADSLAQNLGHYLTDAETSAVISVMKARNYNFTNAKDWDRARLCCVRQGTLSKTLMYPAEKLDELISETDFSTNEFEKKRELRKAERLLMGR